MKPYIVAFVAALVGAAAGTYIVHSYDMRLFTATIPPALQLLETRQQYTCGLSLAVLDRLETGETDRAKLLLAREVASYYKHPVEHSDSPQRKKLLTLIEGVRPKSSVLDQELSKTP